MATWGALSGLPQAFSQRPSPRLVNVDGGELNPHKKRTFWSMHGHMGALQQDNYHQGNWMYRSYTAVLTLQWSGDSQLIANELTRYFQHPCGAHIFSLVAAENSCTPQTSCGNVVMSGPDTLSTMCKLWGGIYQPLRLPYLPSFPQTSCDVVKLGIVGIYLAT